MAASRSTMCSFSIESGECVALVGPNGAGKTTLFLRLCGVLAGKPGEANVCGLDPADPSTAKKLPETIGVVFQNPDDQLFSPTVLDDVAFGPLNLGLTVDEATARALGGARGGRACAGGGRARAVSALRRRQAAGGAGGRAGDAPGGAAARRAERVPRPARPARTDRTHPHPAGHEADRDARPRSGARRVPARAGARRRQARRRRAGRGVARRTRK